MHDRRGECCVCYRRENGMGEEITNLYDELRALDCVLQFVRSGRVAIPQAASNV